MNGKPISIYHIELPAAVDGGFELDYALGFGMLRLTSPDGDSLRLLD